MKGRLIALEGIDGCGKTTQINHLAEWLPISGLMPKKSTLHITREPGGTELGKILRDLLLSPKETNSPAPITELLLYAADRAQHISQIIEPALNQGDWVISDRFSGSTIAYQGYGRELNLEVIKQLETIATQGITPDITIFLEISASESINRRTDKINDRIEAEGEKFLKQVALGFSVLSKKRNWIRVDAQREPYFVSNKIKKMIKENINNI